MERSAVRTIVDLVLAHADGLDQHQVVAGSVEHEGRVAGGTRQPTEVAAGGQAANEDAGVGGVLLHAHAVAEQRSAA